MGSLPGSGGTVSRSSAAAELKRENPSGSACAATSRGPRYEARQAESCRRRDASSCRMHTMVPSVTSRDLSDALRRPPGRIGWLRNLPLRGRLGYLSCCEGRLAPSPVQSNSNVTAKDRSWPFSDVRECPLTGRWASGRTLFLRFRSGRAARLGPSNAFAPEDSK